MCDFLLLSVLSLPPSHTWFGDDDATNFDSKALRGEFCVFSPSFAWVITYLPNPSRLRKTTHTTHTSDSLPSFVASHCGSNDAGRRPTFLYPFPFPLSFLSLPIFPLYVIEKNHFPCVMFFSPSVWFFMSERRFIFNFFFYVCVWELCDTHQRESLHISGEETTFFHRIEWKKRENCSRGERRKLDELFGYPKSKPFLQESQDSSLLIRIFLLHPSLPKGQET